jgi:hypothetical protein
MHNYRLLVHAGGGGKISISVSSQRKFIEGEIRQTTKLLLPYKSKYQAYNIENGET